MQSDLEQDISELATSEGMDLVGFTNLERLAKLPPSGDITSVLPSARSAVGLAVGLDFEASRAFMAKEDYFSRFVDYKDSYRKMKNAGLAIVRYLEARGYEAVSPYANFDHVDGTSPRQMTPTISHKYVCEAAGIGWHGWSGNLLTSEFGALVTIGSVITSAELTPSPLVEEDWCSTCRICVATCPTHYMPKQEADVVEIADKPVQYAKRRTALRCVIACGGAHSAKSPRAKWATWSDRNIEGLPGRLASDDEFDAFCERELKNNPDDQLLSLTVDGRVVTQIPDWKTYDEIVDRLGFACGYCQLVCVPGMDERRKLYRVLVESGRIKSDDPRLQPPPDTAEETIIKFMPGALDDDPRLQPPPIREEETVQHSDPCDSK